MFRLGKIGRSGLSFKQAQVLAEQIDIRIGTKSKSGLKGWSSSKLKTAYIRTYNLSGLIFLLILLAHKEGPKNFLAPVL